MECFHLKSELNTVTSVIKGTVQCFMKPCKLHSKIVS